MLNRNVAAERIFQTAHPDAEQQPRASGIQMFVPYDAKIVVNGQEMKGRGEVRRFSSEPLVKGVAYNYEVKMEVVRNGERVTKTELVQLQPGKITNIEMDMSDVLQTSYAANETVTSLKVNVPMDASVYLEGQDTVSVGKAREFNTTDLKKGEVWKNYTVRVEIERDGKTLTKVQKINLRGGETREVRFDFSEGVAFNR